MVILLSSIYVWLCRSWPWYSYILSEIYNSAQVCPLGNKQGGVYIASKLNENILWNHQKYYKLLSICKYKRLICMGLGAGKDIGALILPYF